MHDIKAIRADPAAFDAAMARRGLGPVVASMLKADEKLRQSRTELDALIATQRRVSPAIAQAKATGEEAEAFLLARKANEIKAQMPAYESQIAELDSHYLHSASLLPNLPAADVPDGLDESGNVVIHTYGTLPTFDFAPKEHDTLALRFGYDPDAAAAISGARFAVLRGPLARLHRALGQFMLDANIAAGWTEVAPPLLVRREGLFGTGQLPKFEDDLFKTTGEPPRYLIPTAEVSLTNSIRGRVLDADELPLRLTALTPCFRAEAGSAGRDTRGLIRQHQFDKVELVAIVADADAAAAMHEEMTAQAESLLDALGLPFRRMLLCAGDMGFAARKTYDLEVWLPGQNAYREISSISDCGDFQARRMDIDEPKGGRFKVRGQKGTHFVHTLNGSALAVGRCLVAVIENYQRADDSVRVPNALLGYMGGVTELTPKA